jgi:hypothetical protein
MSKTRPKPEFIFTQVRQYVISDFSNTCTVNFMCKRTSMFFWSADVNTENYIGRTYAEMERCICVCALDDPAPVR